jgi:hypothetical protein
MLDQEPQSKKIKQADAVAFRRAVHEQLKALNQLAFRGDVLLQFDFFTSSRNPPAIDKLPKNYLDLMRRQHPKEPDEARDQLLLLDDRKVRALIARYHLGRETSKPAVWIQAEPYRDFLADLDLIERIRHEDFEDDGDSWRRSAFDDFRDGPFQDDDDTDNDGFQRLAELDRNRESYLRLLSNDAFECQREMTHMDAHRAHLRQSERLACLGLLYALRTDPRKKRELADRTLSRVALQTRDMTLRAPFILELHHAPRRSGESGAFNQVLREKLNDFKAERHYLFPLRSMLNLTIAMIPPAGREVDGIKDLDNLATTIVRAVHEIWTPPISFAHAFRTDNIQDEGLRTHWEHARNEVPKAMKTSITEYRVFTLPRLPGDPKDGFVRLAVGDGMRPIQFREEIDEYLEKWADSVDR